MRDNTLTSMLFGQKPWFHRDSLELPPVTTPAAYVLDPYILTETDIHPLGFKVGDTVNWEGPYNHCQWGKCVGTTLIETEGDNAGHMVVYWWKTCNRHPARKHTHSDPIESDWIKVRIAEPVAPSTPPAQYGQKARKVTGRAKV